MRVIKRTRSTSGNLEGFVLKDENDVEITKSYDEVIKGYVDGSLKISNLRLLAGGQLVSTEEIVRHYKRGIENDYNCLEGADYTAWNLATKDPSSKSFRYSAHYSGCSNISKYIDLRAKRIIEDYSGKRKITVQRFDLDIPKGKRNNSGLEGREWSREFREPFLATANAFYRNALNFDDISKRTAIDSKFNVKLYTELREDEGQYIYYARPSIPVFMEIGNSNEYEEVNLCLVIDEANQLIFFNVISGTTYREENVLIRVRAYTMGASVDSAGHYLAKLVEGKLRLSHAFSTFNKVDTKNSCLRNESYDKAYQRFFDDFCNVDSSNFTEEETKLSGKDLKDGTIRSIYLRACEINRLIGKKEGEIVELLDKREISRQEVKCFFVGEKGYFEFEGVKDGILVLAYNSCDSSVTMSLVHCFETPFVNGTKIAHYAEDADLNKANNATKQFAFRVLCALEDKEFDLKENMTFRV